MTIELVVDHSDGQRVSVTATDTESGWSASSGFHSKVRQAQLAARDALLTLIAGALEFAEPEEG